MKIKTLIAVAAIGLLTACGTPYRATDTTVVVAPDGTQRAFITQYPSSSNVVWSRYDPSVVVVNDWDLAGWQVLDANDYAVRFNMDGEDYYAWYDSDGNWVGTAYVINDYSRLPVLVNNMLVRDYNGYTISSAHREYYKDRNAYEIVMKRSDGSKTILLVDADGNVLKSKVKQ